MPFFLILHVTKIRSSAISTLLEQGPFYWDSGDGAVGIEVQGLPVHYSLPVWSPPPHSTAALLSRAGGVRPTHDKIRLKGETER